MTDTLAAEIANIITRVVQAPTGEYSVRVNPYEAYNMLLFAKEQQRRLELAKKECSDIKLALVNKTVNYYGIELMADKALVAIEGKV